MCLTEGKFGEQFTLLGCFCLTSCLCSYHRLLLSGLQWVFYFFYFFYYLLCFFFIFHLVRQPYSETSCSCVLVDWSIVWKGDQSKPKRKVKGMTRAINCTLFSFLKCEEMWNIIPGLMGLSKHRYWICCYIYCLHLQVFCAFASLSRGLVPYFLRFFFCCQLYIVHIT